MVPETVTQRGDGFYTVDYGRVTPVLVEAIKELDGIVRQRDAEIAAQRRRIEADTHRGYGT